MSNPTNISIGAQFRPLGPKSKFDSLIPRPDNTRINLGDGNTDYSIKSMIYVSQEFAKQAIELAKVLKGSSLDQTIRNVKDFVYNNFQYKADGSLQQLYSLARAWQDRENGIDCKSYSLITSQILTCLGIPHYFARIKQANDGSRPAGFENAWSHVFVLVPKSGSTITSLDSAFVIDGVVSYNHLPPYLKIDLTKVPMNHEFLNGVAGMGCPSPYASAQVAKTIETPIATSAQKAEDLTGKTMFILTIQDANNKDLKQTYKTPSEATMRSACSVATATPDAKKQMAGLGFVNPGLGEIATLIAAGASIVSGITKLFPGVDEEKETQHIRDLAKSENWYSASPGTNGLGINNINFAPGPELEAMAAAIKANIEGAQAAYNTGDAGKKRVMSRYITVFGEHLKAVGDMYQSKFGKPVNSNIPGSAPTKSGSLISSANSTSNNSASSSLSTSGVKMAGMNWIQWVLLAGAGLGVAYGIKQAGESDKKRGLSGPANSGSKPKGGSRPGAGRKPHTKAKF